jgi:hypothetical protein
LNIPLRRREGSTKCGLEPDVLCFADDNPPMNAAITFTEPFPIGLLVTVVSAAVLRKK